MSRRRVPITFDDHEAIGAMLREATDSLCLITPVVRQHYGAALARLVVKTERTVQSLFYELREGTFDLNLGSPYDAAYTVSDVRQPWPHYLNERAHVRRLATTVIEPEIAYEPPSRPRGGSQPCGPLTFREHLVIGKLLYQIRADLMALFVNRLQHAHGKTHITVRRAERSVRVLDSLRSMLDGRVCGGEYLPTVHIVDGVEITHAYYGGLGHLKPKKRDFLRDPFGSEEGL